MEEPPITLNWEKAQDALGDILALQHSNIHETPMPGIGWHRTWVSTRDDLSPKMFIG